MKRILYQPFFIRLFNWEYWPFNVVYGPLFLYWFFLSLRARSFFFFNTSNPTIKNGGFLMESKKEVYDLIPFEYYPATLFFKTATGIGERSSAFEGLVTDELACHRRTVPADTQGVNPVVRWRQNCISPLAGPFTAPAYSGIVRFQ